MVRSGVGAAPVVEPVPTGGRTAAGAAGGCRGGASGAGREGRVGSVEGRKSRGTGRPPAGSGGVLGEPRSLPAGSSVADRSPPVRAETGEGMAFRRRAADRRALVARRGAREGVGFRRPAAGPRGFGAPRSGVPGRDRVVPPDRRSGERSLLAGVPARAWCSAAGRPGRRAPRSSARNPAGGGVPPAGCRSSRVRRSSKRSPGTGSCRSTGSSVGGTLVARRGAREGVVFRRRAAGAPSASLVGAEPCRGRSSTGGLPVVEDSALPEAESGEGMVFFRRLVGRGALVARRGGCEGVVFRRRVVGR